MSRKINKYPTYNMSCFSVVAVNNRPVVYLNVVVMNEICDNQKITLFLWGKGMV